jgi:hypothetical protein
VDLKEDKIFDCITCGESLNGIWTQHKFCKKWAHENRSNAEGSPLLYINVVCAYLKVTLNCCGLWNFTVSHSTRQISSCCEMRLVFSISLPKHETMGFKCSFCVRKPHEIAGNVLDLIFYLIETSYRQITLYIFFSWRNGPLWARASTLSRLHSHTQTNHFRQDSSGRAISPTQRPLPAKT